MYWEGVKKLLIFLLFSLKGFSSAFAISELGKHLPNICGVQQQRSSRSFLASSSRGGGAAHQSSSEIPNDTLPLDYPRRDDVLIALDAVRQACRVCRALQPVGNVPGEEEEEKSNKGIGTVEKKDLSPVTVGDFAVQALVLHLLHSEFPSDGFIAEEDSTALLADESLLQQVLAATGLSISKEDMLQGLDLGKSYSKWTTGEGNNPRPKRVWCLDPIDGTRGFLRGRKNGGQYAIALALIEDGEPVIGILGCPNLPTSVNDEQYAWAADETETNNRHSRGCIFVASRGGGCYQLPLESELGGVPAAKLQVTTLDDRKVREGRFCIGVEKFSDALGQTDGMAKILYGNEATLDDMACRRMDSQAKHGVIARGGAEYYVRLPKKGYVEWIWDHAAGNVVIEEAGGKMTDTDGQPLDFSLGPQLSPTVRGVLMSNGGSFHNALVDAFAQEEAQRRQQSQT